MLLKDKWNFEIQKLDFRMVIKRRIKGDKLNIVFEILRNVGRFKNNWVS